MIIDYHFFHHSVSVSRSILNTFFIITNHQSERGFIGSRGWGFRKAGAAFPCFLFLVPYLLFKPPLPRLKPWAMVNVEKIVN